MNFFLFTHEVLLKFFTHAKFILAFHFVCVCVFFIFLYKSPKLWVWRYAPNVVFPFTYSIKFSKVQGDKLLEKKRKRSFLKRKKLSNYFFLPLTTHHYPIGGCRVRNMYGNKIGSRRVWLSRNEKLTTNHSQSTIKCQPVVNKRNSP